MRFFRPAFSPAVSTKIALPLVFPIQSKSIKKIWVSPDLSLMQVQHAACETTPVDKIRFALEQGLEEIPDGAELSVQQESVLQVSGLYSVAIELSKMIQDIKRVDPTFFTDLKIYEDNLKSNVVDNPLSLGDFMLSDFHMRYFQLQNMRRIGVKHTIEFPLRFLRSHALLSLHDLNQMMLKIWLQVSEIEKQHAAKLADLSRTTDDVPYVFRH